VQVVLETFSGLAACWERLPAHGGDPDSYVRATLRRKAIGAARGQRDDVVRELLPQPVEAAAVGDEATSALDRLPPRRRADVVLRALDGDDLSGAAAVLSVPARDLGAALRRAGEGLPPSDLAARAWHDAVVARHGRRRAVVGWAAATAVAGVLVAGAVGWGGSGPAPLPAPSTPPTTARQAGTLRDGTAYALMPLEGTEGGLATFPAGLPPEVDVAAPAQRLSDLTRAADPVALLYLRRVGDDRFEPVVVTSTGRQVLVDRLVLSGLHDAEGRVVAPLGPRALGGGRYAVFPQPGRIVWLDTRTGLTKDFPLPATDVVSVGWTADQGALVARSGSRSWTLDPWAPGGQATPADGSYAGLVRLDADERDPGRRVLVSLQARDGRPGTGGVLPAPVTAVTGETVGTEQRAAAGAVFDQDVTHPVGGFGDGPVYQGLVAVDVGSWTSRVLLAPESPDGQTGRLTPCCSVLGWADADTVLFETRGVHGQWVLAWDVERGTVYRVTRLAGVAPDGGRAPVAVALNVGWRH
jgi:hypothetical protein